MKKVIMSALIGAIFGGAVVAFSTNNNFVNIAEASVGWATCCPR